MNTLAGSPLLAQLRETDRFLRAAGIDYALIGGVAVNLHGVLRATADLDMLMRSEDAEPAHHVFVEHGYEPIDRREDIASYVRHGERLDVLFARRPISRNLLARASEYGLSELRLRAISVEGLVGLKVQALSDDPRRLKDLNDLVELFKVHRDRMDLDEVRTYFRLFNRERLLDDLLRATD